MAREHARIHTSIWLDDDFLDLTPGAQHLYFVLTSQMTLSFCGVTTWHPGRISQMAMGWSVHDVKVAAVELSQRSYIVIDEGTDEVLVRSFIRNDGLLTSPNISKAMYRTYSEIGSRTIRAVVVHELKRLHDENPRLKGWEVCGDLLEKRSMSPSDVTLFSVNENPSGSISKPFQNNESNPIDTPYSLLPTPNSPTPNSPQKIAAYPADFETAWALYPKKTSKKAAATSFAKALKEVPLETLLDAITRHRDDPNREAKFTKHFSTWLNQGCWDDEPLPPKNISGSDQRLARGYQMAQQLSHRAPQPNVFPDHEPDYQKVIES